MLGVAQNMATINQRLIDNIGRPPQPQQQQAPQIGADDYVTGAQLLAAQQQAIQQYQPDVNAGIELGASGNLGYVKTQYQKEFQKYGAEITALLAGVPKKSWTLDNLTFVIDTVRGRHFADYQAEWQTESNAKMEQTIRSSGVGGSAPVTQDNKDSSLESEKIPVEWKLRAEKAGVTEATVREFCASNDMTAEQFYKQFETPKNAIVAEVQSGR